MNTDYIQNLRYKLQKRVRRLNSSEYQVFHSVLKQFDDFLRKEPMLVGILNHLEAHTPQVKEAVDRIFTSHETITFDTELENATACYLVIQKCTQSEDSHIETTVAKNYSHEKNYNEILEAFKDIFLEPFYEYLDENLDDKGSILSLLQHYKHKCEWFQREKLLEIFKLDTQRGEKNLALHLYEYLHDQGLKFYIEPTSISGEADLVSSQTEDEPLIADAKIFKGNNKSYIAKGFRQLYNYTLDYNEPFGFLIIYKTCEQDLKFALQDTTLKTPFICHNNKTIFFIIIDIFSYESSASKRGKLKFVELIEDDLLQALKE